MLSVEQWIIGTAEDEVAALVIATGVDHIPETETEDDGVEVVVLTMGADPIGIQGGEVGALAVATGIAHPLETEIQRGIVEVGVVVLAMTTSPSHHHPLPRSRSLGTTTMACLPLEMITRLTCLPRAWQTLRGDE